MKRIFQSISDDAVGVAADGNKGDSVTDVPADVEGGRAVQKRDLLCPINQTNADVCSRDFGRAAKAVAMSQQKHIGQRLIPPATQCAEDDDLGYALGDSVIEGEFEISFVLARRITKDACPRSFECGDAIRRNRVEVADKNMWIEAQGQAMVCPAIGGNDEIVGTKNSAGGFRVGEVAIGKYDSAAAWASQKNTLRRGGCEKMI